MNQTNRLLGVLSLILTTGLPVPVLALTSAAGPAPTQTPLIVEPHSTEIAVYLERKGEPVPAETARDVSVRVDFFADATGDQPVGPFVILQPMPGTSVYRATLPAIDEGGVKSARITLMRAGSGSHDEPLPVIFPMVDNRLKAEIDLPSGV